MAYRVTIGKTEHELSHASAWSESWGQPIAVDFREIEARIGKTAASVLWYILCRQRTCMDIPWKFMGLYNNWAAPKYTEQYPPSHGEWTESKLKVARGVLKDLNCAFAVKLERKEALRRGLSSPWVVRVAGIDRIQAIANGRCDRRYEKSFVAVMPEMMEDLRKRYPIRRQGARDKEPLTFTEYLALNNYDPIIQNNSEVGHGNFSQVPSLAKSRNLLLTRKDYRTTKCTTSRAKMHNVGSPSVSDSESQGCLEKYLSREVSQPGQDSASPRPSLLDHPPAPSVGPYRGSPAEGFREGIQTSTETLSNRNSLQPTLSDSSQWPALEQDGPSGLVLSSGRGVPSGSLSNRVLGHPGAFPTIHPKDRWGFMEFDVNQPVKKAGPFYQPRVEAVPDRVAQEDEGLADILRALKPQEKNPAEPTEYGFIDPNREHLTTLAEMRRKFSWDDDDLCHWLVRLQLNTFRAWAKEQGGEWSRRFANQVVSPHKVKAVVRANREYLMTVVTELKTSSTPVAPVLWAAMDRAAYRAGAPREPYLKQVMGSLLNNKTRGMMASPWVKRGSDAVFRQNQEPFTAYTKLLLEISARASTLDDVRRMVSEHAPGIEAAKATARAWVIETQRKDREKLMHGECVAGPKPLKEDCE